MRGRTTDPGIRDIREVMDIIRTFLREYYAVRKTPEGVGLRGKMGSRGSRWIVDGKKQRFATSRIFRSNTIGI